MTKKRCLSLFVENEVGVLAYVSGLFSGKSYNLDSLTVGTTEDNTVSRMTITLTSDDQTFEQIKKQLNRSVDIIKVVDLSDSLVYIKELMFLRVDNCASKAAEIECAIETFDIKIIDNNTKSLLIQSVQSEERNSEIINFFKSSMSNQIEVVRGGNVAVEKTEYRCL